MSENSERREEARREVLRFLADRNLLAHSPQAIRSGVNREGFDFAKDEILGALQSLESGKYISVHVDPLGSTKTYQATLEGTLLQERSETT
jgi:hypothetical protein